MTRRLSLPAIALVAALGLSACTNNDAKESDVVNSMRDAGLDEAEAECIGQGFEEAFGDDQDLFNDVAAAGAPEDLPESTEETIDAIFEDCGLEPIGDGDDGDGDGTTDEDPADEDTTDTSADETTTTAS